MLEEKLSPKYIKMIITGETGLKRPKQAESKIRRWAPYWLVNTTWLVKSTGLFSIVSISRYLYKLIRSLTYQVSMCGDGVG